MNELFPVENDDDILPAYRDTPVGALLRYHNLEWPQEHYTHAQLLIGMCMAHPKTLHIPDNFAYILRAGGANLRPIEFKVSYAVAVGGIRTIALIGHDQCGMADLPSQRETFVRGLVENAGWGRSAAEQHFDQVSPMFEIGEPIRFVRLEAGACENATRRSWWPRCSMRLSTGVSSKSWKGECGSSATTGQLVRHGVPKAGGPRRRRLRHPARGERA